MYACTCVYALIGEHQNRIKTSKKSKNFLSRLKVKMGKLRPLLKRRRIPVETCPDTGKRFKRRKNGNRTFVCPHDKAPGQCNEGDCLKNKRKPSKANCECPCGSEWTLAYCRNCDTPGAGAKYCKSTGKRKARCPCGAETCGALLCEHKKEFCNECNPIKYLLNLVRSRTYQVMKGYVKSKRTMEYVGMSAPEYRVYIDSTFQPGMTRENYGSEWEVGHRIPLKYQNPTLAEIEERLHYSNTFAQWEIDNSEQGNQHIFTKY